MIKELINKIVQRQDLTQDEAKGAMECIMSGEATAAQIAAFITALRMKGETVDEIAGCAKAMRQLATHVEVKGTPVALESDGANQAEEIIVDTCGTGGDESGTYNISTAVSIVAAAAGVKVVKHGNRSVSSKCGCADVLEEVGVRIDLKKEETMSLIGKTNFGFLFAPSFHQAMRFVGPIRRTLGFRTIFNILGPLANPAFGEVSHCMGVR